MTEEEEKITHKCFKCGKDLKRNQVHVIIDDVYCQEYDYLTLVNPNYKLKKATWGHSLNHTEVK